MKVLVTGGGGFVGGYLVHQLLERGYSVRAVGRSLQPDLSQLGVDFKRGDLIDKAFVQEVCEGMDAVFHVAAKAGVWGSWNSFYEPNVVGSRNVVSACLKAGVERLVYTSTPSVVFNRRPISGGDESMPYGEKWLCHYAHTKAIAERETLAAHSKELKICALRPHLIFGPGDNHLLPRVISSAISGRLKIIGDGTNQVDVSYVSDVAEAHLNALDALESGIAGGKAYFISQGTPVVLWPWLNEILEGLGHRPLTRKIPLGLAYPLSSLLEAVWKVTGKAGDPPITRFVAVELAKDHYFSISAAKRDLNYLPKVSAVDALDLTLKDLYDRGYGVDE